MTRRKKTTIKVDVQPRPHERVKWITQGQKNYLDNLSENIVTLCAGAPGTGKTWMAVGYAVELLMQNKVSRIVISRPIVSTGEQLGFLPGSAEDKASPYMQPLYDAFTSFMTKDEYMRYKGMIELVPLAYMRGRAQPLDAVVYTPNGPVKMGDIKVGDYVLSANGQKTLVDGVYPQGVKKVYEITFNDGSSTLCCEDHLWSVEDVSNRRNKKNLVLSTKELIKNGLRNNRGIKKYKIPVCQPVEFDNKWDSDIDPYVLGVLLGDGTMSSTASIQLTSGDQEIFDTVEKLVPSDLTFKRIDKYSQRLTGKAGRPNSVKDELKKIGVWGKRAYEKFIPESCLYVDIDSRIELLRGLMDTDGSIYIQKDRSPRMQFYTTSDMLADGVLKLIYSIGGTASKRVRPINHNDSSKGHNYNCIIIDFKLNINPFKLSRKAILFNDNFIIKRFISNIKYHSSQECQCISVDHESSLYLTDNFIVTHNTFKNAFIIGDEFQNASVMQCKMFVSRMGENSRLVMCGDTKQCDIRDTCGLTYCIDKLAGLDGVGVVELTQKDVVRSGIVQRMIERLGYE